MGILLDSSVLIAAERRGDIITQVIEDITRKHGDQRSAISTVTIIETHAWYLPRKDSCQP